MSNNKNLENVLQVYSVYTRFLHGFPNKTGILRNSRANTKNRSVPVSPARVQIGKVLDFF